VHKEERKNMFTVVRHGNMEIVQCSRRDGNHKAPTYLPRILKIIDYENI
jgi:hypothetical protein